MPGFLLLIDVLWFYKKEKRRKEISLSVWSSVFSRFGFSNWSTWLLRDHRNIFEFCWALRVSVCVCINGLLCHRICFCHPAVSFRLILRLDVRTFLLFISSTIPVRSRIIPILVYHFCHIQSLHETRDMTDYIFITLLFTISDKLCCFSVGYLQVSAPHPACE